MKYDLGWGNSPAVREAFLNVYNGKPIVFTRDDLMKFDYPVHEGDPELIEITRKVIKRQIGLDYKHVIITNGATGGVVISLRAFKQIGYTTCLTRNPPYYVRYPGMIASANLEHHIEVQIKPYLPNIAVALLDVPSNPQGFLGNPLRVPNVPVILDGVYYNKVYISGNANPIPHDVFVGSYSKLLGTNGIRIGWIATNDNLLYERLRELITSEYCGLSTSSTILLKNSLLDFKWDSFESQARTSLDMNREEWSKLERFFDREVSGIGMFYYAHTDIHCKKLMEKSGIKWTSGDAMGMNDDFGRFNLGQDNRLIRNAVRDVLKNDKILKKRPNP